MRELAGLLQAALRTLDDVMHLAMRDPHSGALPAATAVQVLTELLMREHTQPSHSMLMAPSSPAG